MAVIPLTDPQACSNFWQRCVLMNLAYWKGYLERHIQDIPDLEGEREAIFKAVTFGLELSEGWPLVYPLIVQFSDFMERRGYWSSWQPVLNRAQEIARQASNETAQITLSVLLARLRQRQGLVKPMVADYRRTIRLARQVGDRFNEGRACTNLGFYFIVKGHWFRGEVLCRHALCIFEEIGSDHGRAHTENHLGVLYDCQRRWDEALPHYERACDIWQTMGDQHGLMRGLINLGVVSVNMNQSARGIACLNQALTLAEQAGEVAEICVIYVDMAMAHLRQESLHQAEEYAGQAVLLSQQHGNSPMLAQAWRYLGLACLHQGRQPEAKQHLQAALELVRHLKIPFREIEILLDLFDCEMIAGTLPWAARWLHTAEQLVARERLQQTMQPLLHQARQKFEAALD